MSANSSRSSRQTNSLTPEQKTPAAEPSKPSVTYHAPAEALLFLDGEESEGSTAPASEPAPTSSPEPSEKTASTSAESK